MKNYKYKAFISYSHKDISFARWLHKKIENYKIPKSLRKKYPNLPKDLKRSIFRDEEELPTSDTLPVNLTIALEESKFLIVICSPNSVGYYKKISEINWVDKEIRHFKVTHNNQNVLAIIVDGEPNANIAENEAFPEALKYEVDQNGSLTHRKVYPIAGDARKHLGRYRALIKLIAGILKVDFSDLWEREKRERKKRLLYFLFWIAIFIVLLAYSAKQVTGEKINSEIESYKNSIAKIEYRLRHEVLQEGEMTTLISKLRKLKQKIREKEDTLKWLGKAKSSNLKKVSSVYKKHGAKKAIQFLALNEAKREKKIVEISREYVTLAKLYVEISDYKKANQYYDKAIKTYFDFFNVIEYVSYLANQNNIEDAIRLAKKMLSYKLNNHQKIRLLPILSRLYNANHQIKKSIETSVQLVHVLTKMNKKDNKYSVRLLEEYLALSRVFVSIGERYSSKMAFLESVSLRKKSIKQGTFVYDLITARQLAQQGYLFFRFGQDKEATLSYEKAIELLKKLIKTNPKQIKPIIAATLNDLAMTMSSYPNLAKEKYKEALELYINLATKNPSKYLEFVGNVRNNLGAINMKLHLYDDAKKEYEKSKDIYMKLFKIDPRQYGDKLEISYVNLGQYYLENNNTDDALTMYEKGLHIGKILEKNFSIYTSTTTNCYFALGEIYSKNHRVNDAIDMYEQTIKSFKERSRLYVKEMKSLAKAYYRLIRMYIQMNHLDEIIQSVKQLINIHEVSEGSAPQEIAKKVLLELDEFIEKTIKIQGKSLQIDEIRRSMIKLKKLVDQDVLEE